MSQGMRETRFHAHESARDRLLGLGDKPADHDATHKRTKLQYVQRLYADYRAALDRYFRGQEHYHEVLVTRLRYNDAESRLVTERAHESKPWEFTAERWHGARWSLAGS